MPDFNILPFVEFVASFEYQEINLLVCMFLGQLSAFFSKFFDFFIKLVEELEFSSKLSKISDFTSDIELNSL
jgi:hypothetical protein